jgi:hypothetical protein
MDVWIDMFTDAQSQLRLLSWNGNPFSGMGHSRIGNRSEVLAVAPPLLEWPSHLWSTGPCVGHLVRPHAVFYWYAMSIE